jgi:hypothetical protein
MRLVSTAIAVAMGLPCAVHRANASPVEAPPATECEALARVDFSGIVDAPTQMMSAETIEVKRELPAYFKVKGYVTPPVEIHLALPSPWNGKLIELGSVGEIHDEACNSVLRRGYACVTSDMGMKSDLSFYNNLQANVDNGFRAAHVVSLAGKAITEKYYAGRLQKAYFMGCSVGGRQALVEAQRFPWDFDGIIAGAPPVNQTMVYTNLAWASRAIHDSEGNTLLRTNDLQLLKEAAIAKCDLDDGVQDGVIGNPLNCSFDPSELSCKKDRARGCLTPEQVAAAKKIYSGPVTTGGTRLLPGGPFPGSEQANVDWGFAGWGDVYGDQMVSTVTQWV